MEIDIIYVFVRRTIIPLIHQGFFSPVSGKRLSYMVSHVLFFLTTDLFQQPCISFTWKLSLSFLCTNLGLFPLEHILCCIEFKDDSKTKTYCFNKKHQWAIMEILKITKCVLENRHYCFMRFGILELRNRVTLNDVTLRVSNSKIYIEILLSSY